MIIAIVVLSGYYVVQNGRIRKAHEQQRIQRTEDSLKKIPKKETVPVSNLDTVLDVNYLEGRFNPAKEISFTEVDLKYGSREGLYVREETYGAFIKMYEAALKDGVKLMIISATRNFDYQKGIWEAKWTGKRLVDGKNLATAITDPVERARIILKYSSMPGTSRHHWGTDVDLNSMDPKYFDTDAGKKIYNWLLTNASKYYFCQPYTSKDAKRPKGYEEEKWHWSYMPIAKQCLAAYKLKVAYADLKGFSGSETAEKLKVIGDYVMGINGDCK
jgi:zinc D-Ala-D-Ala carboxypeptidase